MIRSLLVFIFLLSGFSSMGWGFFGHRQIHYYAVFLLPPEMMVLYKPQIGFLTEHAVDPDKRRYVITEEAPRHYIDIDHYGTYPYPGLPRKYKAAEQQFGRDSLLAHGIVPWHIQTMLSRLTEAFRQKDFARIMKTSADLGHYIADAHVPLHASSNHNGQLTNQTGIHGFWESRVPELLAEKEFDFYIGKARYISDPGDFIWKRVLESARAADTVLQVEKMLTATFPPDRKFAYEERNGKLVRQYSEAFTIAFNKKLEGMVERRMRQSIFAVASFWFTAWVNAGQPDLKPLLKNQFTETDTRSFEELNKKWKESGNQEH